MSDLALKVCKQFASSLHEWIGEVRQFGVLPEDRDWMEKFLILFALEDCQSSFQAQGKPKPICRFSMGLSKEETKAKLQRYLILLRAKRLQQKFDKFAAKILHESLVDYSLSNYSLPQAYGDRRAAPMPKDSQFELLMIAESEMGTRTQVLEDFLKLACVYASFKVMVYKALKRNADRLKLKDGFERAIKVARKPDDNAEWLLVGVPGYRQWIDAWDDPSTLTTSVYYLSPKQNALVPHAEWWKWPTDAVRTFEF